MVGYRELIGFAGFLFARDDVMIRRNSYIGSLFSFSVSRTFGAWTLCISARLRANRMFGTTKPCQTLNPKP